MPDRDKVIKAIDICLGHGKYDDCGYRIKGGFGTMDCRKPMMCDALAMLKEQEEEIENLKQTEQSMKEDICLLLDDLLDK